MSMTPEQHLEAMYGLCIARITDAADSRMRLRTAKEQHAAAMEALNRKQDESRNDDEDDSSLRNNVLR
jgi:hypothetical protein